MAIRVTTNFDSYIPPRVELIEQKIVECLLSLGQQCNVKARKDGIYEDATGDLRSSIGYAVALRGQIVEIGGFEQVKQGSKGCAEGRALAKKLLSDYPDDYVLVVVAGSKHAEYVESINNCVVLASAELFAQQKLSKMLKQLQFK